MIKKVYLVWHIRVGSWDPEIFSAHLSKDGALEMVKHIEDGGKDAWISEKTLEE